jgi:hypothetical protein
MNRWIGRTLAAGAVAVVVTACVENKGSIFVQGIMAPPTPQVGQACTYAPQASSSTLFSGTLDVGFSDSYTPVFLIANQMVQRGSSSQVRAESSRVQLLGGVVRLTDTAGAQLANFTALGSGYADASSGNTPGFGAIALTVIDPATVEKVLRPAVANGSSKRVIAYVKVYGQTLGGLRVEAGEYPFPIDVCSGCLVRIPSDAPTCISTGASAQIINPCIMGQDQTIDCRLCNSFSALCRP